MLKKNRQQISERIKSIVINLPIVNATVSFAGWGLALVGSFVNFQNYDIKFETISLVKFILFNVLISNLCFLFILSIR